MDKIKTIILGYGRGGKRPRKTLKVEFPGGMVVIHVGLTNIEGQAVNRVDVTADGDRYAGDPQWWAHWSDRVDASGAGCRIIQHEHVKPPHGECDICHHFGEDCTGKEPAVSA